MCLFGDIVAGEMLLNDFGRVAHEVWERIPAHFAMVETDAWIVMPNHVHGVIFIAGPDTGGLPSAGTNAGEGVAPRPIRATHASPVPSSSCHHLPHLLPGGRERAAWRFARLLREPDIYRQGERLWSMQIRKWASLGTASATRC